MFKKVIKKLSDRIEVVERQFDEFSYNEIGSEQYEKAEKEVYSIEDEILDYIHNTEEIEFTQFAKLQERINNIKRENDFYDEEANLDMMFPNRYDDDFDEDSMSYDSVFGGD